VVNHQALEGVNVLDFGWRIVGPLTTYYLACYGATVIKIETRTRPDTHRTAAPFKDNISSPDRSILFPYANAGKYGITLNLKHPRATGIMKKLIQWADVVVDNFAGGKMIKMGLGYESLIEIKPDIIMLSSSMQGQTGPLANTPGYGKPLTAATGFTQITGFPDQMPQFPGEALTDFIAPRMNALAIFAALLYRAWTGKGQYIDAAQIETAVPLLTPLLLEYQTNGKTAERIGNRSTYAAPHGIYRCKGQEKWCSICVFTDEDWAQFCRAIHNPDWTKEEKFATLSGRIEHVDKLDALVEAWTLEHTREEVVSIMQREGVSSGIVKDGEDLDQDPQLKHRHFYWDLEHPALGNFSYSGMPALMSKTPYKVERSPCLGEHNEYVYTKILGIPDEEFVDMMEEGVFE
jgi:benzylsuccinate CoA-transferase BbsF subunit